MYSIRIACSREEVDRLSGELWEAGTLGIREVDDGDGVALIATFEAPNLAPGRKTKVSIGLRKPNGPGRAGR